MPALVLGLGSFLAFLILSAYAHDFMGKSIYQGLTVAYLLALVEIAIVWLVTAIYIRAARATFDPLAEEAIRRRGGEPARGGEGP